MTSEEYQYATRLIAAVLLPKQYRRYWTNSSWTTDAVVDSVLWLWKVRDTKVTFSCYVKQNVYVAQRVMFNHVTHYQAKQARRGMMKELIGHPLSYDAEYNEPMEPVAELLSQGYTWREITKLLGISSNKLSKQVNQIREQYK